MNTPLKRRPWVTIFSIFLGWTLLATSVVLAEGQPVTMTVTAMGKKNAPPPAVKIEDVHLYQDKEQIQVANWRHGENLQLAILIDESLDQNVTVQWKELKEFINAQPASTSIAVGYARNGAVTLAQDFTADHALAAKALRIPIGGPMAFNSPYLALSDWLKRWPKSGDAALEQRSILLISSGIDYFRGSYNPDNPDVDNVIEHAQKQNVNIWTIYYPSSGHDMHRQWPLFVAQGYLSRISEATGAEYYFLAYVEPVSLKPYFDEIQEHLSNQYLLTFLKSSGAKKGKFVHERVTAPDLPQAQFLYQTQVFLPPSQ